MKGGQWFMVDDQVFGVIVALSQDHESEPSAFIPQSLIPNSQEYYENLPDQEILSQIDELVTVFPTIEGAQALMQYMYDTWVDDTDRTVATALFEMYLNMHKGVMCARDDLGIHFD